MSWLWLANQLLGNNYGRDPTDFKVLVVRYVSTLQTDTQTQVCYTMRARDNFWGGIDHLSKKENICT